MKDYERIGLVQGPTGYRPVSIDELAPGDTVLVIRRSFSDSNVSDRLQLRGHVSEVSYKIAEDKKSKSFAQLKIYSTTIKDTAVFPQPLDEGFSDHYFLKEGYPKVVRTTDAG